MASPSTRLLLQKQMNPWIAAVRCSCCLDSYCAMVKPLLTDLLFLVNLHSKGGVVARDAVHGPIWLEGDEQLRYPEKLCLELRFSQKLPQSCIGLF